MIKKLQSSDTNANNIILFVVCIIGLFVVGFSETWAVAARYAAYISCIGANFFFVNTISSNLSRHAKIAVSTILMVAINSLVIYLIFPKVLLIIGFWLPCLVGIAVARLVK